MTTLMRPGVPDRGIQNCRTNSCDEQSGISTEPECDGNRGRIAGHAHAGGSGRG